MKTFLEAANEHQSRATGSKATMRQHAWILARMAAIHDIPVAKLTAPQLFKVMQAAEDAGQFQAAQRMKMLAGRVLRYACATGDRTERDITLDLKRVMTRKDPVVSHPAIVDPGAIGPLLRALDALEGSPSVRMALRLAPHVFVRPSELRSMEWKEVDLPNARWTIPAHKTKMRRPHLVPLSPFVLGALEDANARAVSRWVFHGRGVGHLSQNTLRDGLSRAGYAPDVQTPHGFRSTASTLLNESGRFDPAVIELQLAHFSGDRVARIYNRETRWPERVEMMAWWSAQLEAWKANVPAHPSADWE